MIYHRVLLINGEANFSCKGPASAYSSFVGNMVSIKTPQLFHCSMKEATDSK